MSEFVATSTSGGVAEITLRRPDLHNAFNEVVMQELIEAFISAGADPVVRAVILRSEGKSFCAGADVTWMKRMIDFSFEENVADANLLARMLRTLRECPRPVIVRIHGAAIGGGVGLVAASDIAVAVESATFCLSEVKLGIIPAVISPFVVEKIGMGAMRRYALTAERFPAAEARRIGLIHEVFPTTADMDRWIREQINLILANGPEAVAACKQTLRDVAGFDWDRVQDTTTRRIAERRVSPEGQEGLKSFLEKRPPGWTAT